MSNIAHLPFHNCIVVDFGTVTESTDAAEIGKAIFLISYADNSGVECILYDTADPVMASQETKMLKRDFGAVAVIERFRRQGGQANG